MKHEHYIDTDSRPRTRSCPVCARDVTEGAYCICVPSLPKNMKVTAQIKPKNKPKK